MTGREKETIDRDTRPALPALTIDYALYDRYLEGSDLSEEQKREFLGAMWSIIVEFVMLGFEVHPAQQAQKNACGELPKSGAKPPVSKPDAVESNHKNETDFNEAASGKAVLVAERIQE